MHPQNRKMEQVRDVAQSVEYTSGGREVARSNRVIPTRLQGPPLQPFFIFPLIPSLFHSYLVSLFLIPPSSLPFSSLPRLSHPSSLISHHPPLIPSIPPRPRCGRFWPPFLRHSSPTCPRHGQVWPPYPRIWPQNHQLFPFFANSPPENLERIGIIAIFAA